MSRTNATLTLHLHNNIRDVHTTVDYGRTHVARTPCPSARVRKPNEKNTINNLNTRRE